MSKKFLVFALSCILLLGLVGCAFSVAILPINVATGDKLNVKMQSDDTYYQLEFDDASNLLRMFDGSDEENRYACAFHSEDTLTDYLAIVLNALASENQNVKILDDGAINGVKYTLISFDNGNGTAYEIIGWIQGSNTGLVFDGYISEDETIKAFSALTFEVKFTDQENEKYYYKNINDLEDLM